MARKKVKVSQSKYYIKPNDSDAFHPGKADLNTAMGLYSLTVNPIAGALYFGVYAFYPGGWNGYSQNYDKLQNANQQILGPKFITAPFGSQKF